MCNLQDDKIKKCGDVFWKKKILLMKELFLFAFSEHFWLKIYKQSTVPVVSLFSSFKRFLASLAAFPQNACWKIARNERPARVEICYLIFLLKCFVEGEYQNIFSVPTFSWSVNWKPIASGVFLGNIQYLES